MAKIIPSGVHAVLGIDPGGTTGVAAGHFELRSTLKETLLDGKRSAKETEVKGTWMEQGKEIAALANRFFYTAQVEHQIPLQNIHFAIEDFVLRMPARTTNMTSIWVAAAACAYFDRDDVEVDWQMPSAAKSFATNERLKLWGLWVPGSAHKQDAWRHVVLKLNKILA